MLFVEDGKIYINRGDDAALDVAIALGDGDYTMQDGDSITFTVRAAPSRDEPILIQVESIAPRIVLRHGDTCQLEYGQYSADLELRTADGKRITVFPNMQEMGERERSRGRNWKNFIIMPEVTTHE